MKLHIFELLHLLLDEKMCAMKKPALFIPISKLKLQKKQREY